MSRRLVIALSLIALLGPAVRAQQPPASSPRNVRGLSPESLTEIVKNARPDRPSTLRIANRDVVVFRSAVLGRSAADRVVAAERLIAAFVSDGQPVRVASRELSGAVLVTVNGADIFAMVPADLDALLGETLASESAATVARLQQAMDEAITARHPGALAGAAGEALVATVTFAGLLWVLGRIRRSALSSASRLAERALTSSTVAGDIARELQLVSYVRRVAAGALWLAGLAIGYVWIVFVLRRFPYTRPWGESLRSRLLDRILMLAHGIVDAIPSLITVAFIVLLTRLAIKLVHLVFIGVEQGRYKVPWLYPETAVSTRKILTALLWLFALIVSYPYLPGSDTDAFKGVSVFLGLIVSLGSTGMVNQMMSGFTLTYSRALRTGDFVKLGDLEGTVIHIGTLSTKIETPRGEEVTIPNAVLVSQAVINYSRNADTTGVYTNTSVSIGYDTPWRQVEAMLLLAAERTPGIRQTPPPAVLQQSLDDFAVRYMLLVAPEEPRRRARMLTALHANILDAFNDAGVQIMTPAYEGDPDQPKIVAKEQWFTPPAGGRAADMASLADGSARQDRSASTGR